MNFTSIIADYRGLKLRFLATIINICGYIFFFWIRPCKKIDKQKIKNILIIKFDRIGDTFLSLPTVFAIRKTFPTSKITFLVAPWNYDLLVHEPHIDYLQVYKDAPDVHKNSIIDILSIKNILNLRKEIKLHAPDIFVDLQGNPFIVLAGFLADVKIRAGFKRKLLSFLLNKRVSYTNNLHQSDRYFSLAKSLGYINNIPDLKLYFNDDEKRKIISIIRNENLKNFLVFHLGAGRSYRQWPLEHYIDLASKILSAKPEKQIVLIGGKEDLPLIDNFSRTVKRNVTNLAGKLTIRETYCLLSFAKGLIGNESAPAHLSASLDIPTIMLMNEWSGIDVWKPLGKRVHIFIGEKYHRCGGLDCKTVPCPNMASIKVDKVLNVAINF
jgi:ADP-heptose:LPS heptosyltransferase